MPCPEEQFRLHRIAAAPQFIGQAALFRLQALEPHQFSYILHAVNDELHLAIVAQQRRIHRTPVALLEPAAEFLGPPDVILLRRHGMPSLGGQNVAQRCEKILHSRRLRVVWIIREDFEDTAAHDLVRFNQRSLGISVVSHHDGESRVIRKKHQIQAWDGIEQRTKIRQAYFGSQSALVPGGVHCGRAWPRPSYNDA